MMHVDEVLALDVEKAAAGGRMLARHQGRVVLVSGAIPGERVAARVEKVTSAVAFARTVEVLSPSTDRRVVEHDPRCGGCALAHVAYERQLEIKASIVQDAFSRIARHPLASVPAAVPSPETGYRMRARLHVQGGRLGFFLEGTHQICPARDTGQLSEATLQWIDRAAAVIERERLEGLAAIELTENIAGDQRACHFEVHGGYDTAALAALAFDLQGASAQRADRRDAVVVAGHPVVSDSLRPSDSAGAFQLRRHARSFFQSNRYLAEPLLRHVISQLTGGPVLDLYAGVGLFGLGAAAAGAGAVTLVEGDLSSAADLEANAAGFGRPVRVERRSVEAFVAGGRFPSIAGSATVIVDPPRTGLSKEVLNGLVRAQASRVVYVSCDPATLARDCRGLFEGGYQLSTLTVFDMFPNTAHVETVVVLRGLQAAA